MLFSNSSFFRITFFLLFKQNKTTQNLQILYLEREINNLTTTLKDIEQKINKKIEPLKKEFKVDIRVENLKSQIEEQIETFWTASNLPRIKFKSKKFNYLSELEKVYSDEKYQGTQESEDNKNLKIKFAEILGKDPECFFQYVDLSDRLRALKDKLHKTKKGKDIKKL
ncbi:hypothetical protein EDEG_01677 [Edhazardia aedis USNM 41457]|uniref:Uncharacterized protein n=1 Tax=Edhazardia aedis (strain USNM 41457) TaxID=1003232 RepID=J8ZWK3_EDHAE|nr:hypothetical protein EDEG_01677 [Edhazardia aedis USNM 41457]|eukprot:EJW04043.1 hypothetical protein EDEG_01677 [Edhazardia aedis USNM 41457]